MKTLPTTSPEVSLLDTAGFRYYEWTVVYYPRLPHYFWAKWLKQGFRHCELWRPYRYGEGVRDVAWLRVTPTFELLEAEIDFKGEPPWSRIPGCTVQPVKVLSKAYKIRQWFHFGPMTCTEFCKAALGINNFSMRTPWQLYKYIKQRAGVLKHE
jgi:hypothetical protein